MAPATHPTVYVSSALPGASNNSGRSPHPGLSWEHLGPPARGVLAPGPAIPVLQGHGQVGAEPPWSRTDTPCGQGSQLCGAGTVLGKQHKLRIVVHPGPGLGSAGAAPRALGSLGVGVPVRGPTECPAAWAWVVLSLCYEQLFKPLVLSPWAQGTRCSSPAGKTRLSREPWPVAGHRGKHRVLTRGQDGGWVSHFWPF